MQERILELTEQRQLAPGVYEMRLEGDVSAVCRPGQFINLKLDGFYLRRPISVYDKEADALRIIYKVVGEGTAAMAAYQPGRRLSCLLGLGNGYDLSCAGPAPLLIGGGAGIPPLYWLAKELIGQGAAPQAVLGFNTASERFCEEAFRALGCAVAVTTVDGSYGQKGFVTDALPDAYSYYYACGPEPMLKAVYRRAAGSGQMSFEERMGCGFGACMGCSCKTIAGSKRICKDGPVMRKEEILWED